VAHASYPCMIADLGPGDYFCCLYETKEEHRAVLMPFLRQGLERGEKVYIVDACTSEAILDYFWRDRLTGSPYGPKRRRPWSRAILPCGSLAR
jgi:hypothetical protein